MRGKAYHPYQGKGRRGLWWKLLLALVLLGALCFAALEAVIFAGGHTRIQGEPQMMIVLGCQVKSYGPSQTLQDRLDTALDYLEDHPDMTVVVSGGQGPDEPTTEAQAMYDYMVEHGVDSGQILQEGESHNTAQNLRYTMQLLSEEGYDTTQEMLVVSSDFHLARVRMLWGRVWGSDENLSTLAAPVTHTPTAIQMFFREPLALVKSFVLD